MDGKLRVHISPARLTIDDLIMIEDAQTGVITGRALKDFIARFIVDEDRKPVEYEIAYAMAGRMTMEQLTTTFEGMQTKVKELQAAAVPPGISSS